jgi:hypothetical protein
MGWRTKARFDRHVEHRERARIGIDDSGGDSSEFGRLEFHSDIGLHVGSETGLVC